MTKQEIFDMAAVGLLTQGVRSVDPSTDFCAYRGPEGRKCGAGFCIRDEDYDPSMERMQIAYVIEDHPKLQYLAPHQGFLSQLQWIHDSRDPVLWKFHLLNLANEEGLSSAAIDNL